LPLKNWGTEISKSITGELKTGGRPDIPLKEGKLSLIFRLLS